MVLYRRLEVAVHMHHVEIQNSSLRVPHNSLTQSLLREIKHTYSSDPGVLCRSMERVQGWSALIRDAKMNGEVQHPVFAVMQDPTFQESIPQLPTLAALCVARSVRDELVTFPLQEPDALLEAGRCYPLDHPLFQSVQPLLPVTFEKAGSGALILHLGKATDPLHFSCALPLKNCWYVLGTIDAQGAVSGHVSHVARHVADFVLEAARVGAFGAIIHDGQQTILSYHDGSEAVSLRMPAHAQWECVNKDRGVRFNPPIGENEYVLEFFRDESLRKAAMDDAARTNRVNSSYMHHVLSELSEQCSQVRSILDLGGGRTALFPERFSKEAQYVLVDYRVSKESDNVAPPNVISVRADLDRSDLPKESSVRLQTAGRRVSTVEALIEQSDFIIAANLLNYLEDWKGFVQRLGNAAQSGTTVVVQNAIGRGWASVFANGRPRSNQEICDSLEMHGFSIKGLYAVDPDPSRGKFLEHIPPQLPKEVERPHILRPHCDEHEIVFFIAQKQ